MTKVWMGEGGCESHFLVHLQKIHSQTNHSHKAFSRLDACQKQNPVEVSVCEHISVKYEYL